jgi:hypothetical protein
MFMVYGLSFMAMANPAIGHRWHRGVKSEEAFAWPVQGPGLLLGQALPLLFRLAVDLVYSCLYCTHAATRIMAIPRAAGGNSMRWAAPFGCVP